MINDIFFTFFLLFCGTIFAMWSVTHDIHIFQLNSYRYSRYFRWLAQGNFLSIFRLPALLSVVFLLPMELVCRYVIFIVASLVVIALQIRGREKKKTPLVFTKRVMRLYCTTLLLYVAGVVAGAVFSPECTLVAIGVMFLLSDGVMLLANIVNTPVEKAINRHYYNDAKKIIASHKNLIVIGVTGSFGKTSTKNYMASLLAEKYNILVTPGNFNTLLGVIRTIREQLRPYHQIFIVEMGAKQKNDIKEICDLVHPSIGIVTAVGEMHLETFKTIENIANTKFELINSLPCDGVGIINIDSPHIKTFNGIESRCEIITYGTDYEACYRAEEVKYSAAGVEFLLRKLNGEERYTSRLLGEGNLLNILAAIAVADRLGVPIGKQKNAIARLQPVEHRLSIRNSGGITVIDDAYNSNPQGARMALGVLKNFQVATGNRRIIITPGFVEMGVRQEDANRTLGCDIARCADYAIVVNATNRNAIRMGMEESGMSADRYFLADTLNHAHTHLAAILQVGDVVLYENDLPDNFK